MGINLYHGINDTESNHLKWLNLDHLMSNFLEADQQLDRVFYFTAYANHHPVGLSRHKAYVKALEAVGVSVQLGQFRKRRKQCKVCNERFITHEEKGTDVNIATMMISAAHDNLFDDLFLVSADTDFEHPIKLINQKFPNKRIHIFIPPKRKNHLMLGLGNAQTLLKVRNLRRALFPAVVTRSRGKNIVRPPEYAPPPP